MRLRTLLKLAAVSCALQAFACASVPLSPWDKKPDAADVLEQTDKIMGGNFKVRLWLTPAQLPNAQKFFATSFHELKRIALIADDEDPSSEISRLNRTALNQNIPVSKELFKLVLMSQSLYAMSDGAFDITFVPIQEEIESFGADAGLTESVQEFNPQVNAEVRKKIGQRNLFVDERTSTIKFTRAGMKIGVKGLAKGYAAQKTAEKLLSLKMRGFAILGGGVMVAGGEALQDPNLMCVENPKSLGNCLYRVIPSDPKKPLVLAMAASADRPGRIYNPKTGKRAVKVGGVITLAGLDGAWVQGVSVAISAMDDSKMDAFLSKTGKGLVSSVRFPSVDDVELKGSFAPHAKVKKISP